MKDAIYQLKKNKKLADLHIHSNISDGIMTPDQIVEMAVKEGYLDAIAITDHEVIAGSIEARDYAKSKGYNIDVIIGTELTTTVGHLIILFIEQDIPSGKSLKWTLKEVHNQGGIAIIPHPLYRWTKSIKRKDIYKIIDEDEDEVYFDGFEVYNASLKNNPFTKANNIAHKIFYNETIPLGSAISSTDSHFNRVGLGITLYNDNLYYDIKSKSTETYYLDEKENITLKDFFYNQYLSLILESKRKVQRYIERELKSK